MTYGGVLADVEFFEGFGDEELAMVGATGRHVNYPVGARLFGEGEPASGCWLIERGHVSIDYAGDPAPVDTLGPGDLLGWSWLIPPYRWHYGAVAVAPLSAVRLDTDRLLRFMDSEPALGYRFTRRVCGVLLRRWQVESRHRHSTPH